MTIIHPIPEHLEDVALTTIYHDRSTESFDQFRGELQNICIIRCEVTLESQKRAVDALSEQVDSQVQRYAGTTERAITHNLGRRLQQHIEHLSWSDNHIMNWLGNYQGSFYMRPITLKDDNDGQFAYRAIHFHDQDILMLFKLTFS